ncbi:kelch-like protein 10, partial [Plectropomus leopardus]|uniref:kelch-like protein 10 n=1 Tax=Plectropomus leopardus TaxID=160734 RepID=UPI001C4C9CC4
MNDHHESLHQLSLVLNDLRLEGEFCDAVIKVRDIKFQVHKIVLCRCSPYFIALFKRWLPPDEQIVDIPGLSPDTMKLIIEFAYTGSVSVTEDNVQELLLAADQFNIMHIVQICCNFLGERLCPENCIGIFQLTNFIFHLELRHKAYGYIIAHFEEVVCTEEFPQLSVQELIDILQPDDLNVRSESTVYEAILHWISYKPEERHRYIAELLSK